MLKCEGLQFSMFFDIQANIREQAHKIEISLKDLFPAGFMILPEPGANAPVTIPRILGNSKDNKAQLVITNVSSTFSYVDFNDDIEMESLLNKFENDVCIVYNAIVDVLPAKKMNYCGLVVLYKVPEVPNGNEFIRKKFLNTEAEPKWSNNEKFYDTSVVYTLTKEDKYYINLSISSAHEIETDKSMLRIQLDVNDKYRFAPDVNGASHYSVKDVNKQLFRICKKLLQEQVNKIIG